MALNWQLNNQYDDLEEFDQWLQQKYGIRYPGRQLGAGTGFGMQGGGGNLGNFAGTAGKMAMPFNPVVGLGLQAGGYLLDALRGDPYKKYHMKGLKTAQSMLGKDVLPVNRAIAINRASIVPQISQWGEGINKRLGLNTGRGQQALWDMLLQKEGGFNLEAILENARLKSQRDQYLTSLLAGAGR
jgi:hypothetical protein